MKERYQPALPLRLHKIPDALAWLPGIHPEAGRNPPALPRALKLFYAPSLTVLKPSLTVLNGTLTPLKIMAEGF